VTTLADVPVDRSYEGERKSYINPRECIDCGAPGGARLAGPVGVDTPLVAGWAS
jgi:hypothetical protein